VTEFLTQAIDRVLGGGAAFAALIDEIGRIGILRGRERADTDADQAESRRPGFARQQFAAGVEYLCGELGRRAERARAGAQAKIGALELQGHGGAGELLGLETPGNLLAELPKPALKRTKVGDIRREGCFGRDALGLAIRVDRTRIDAVREACEPLAFGAETAYQLGLVGALEIFLIFYVTCIAMTWWFYLRKSFMAKQQAPSLAETRV